MVVGAFVAHKLAHARQFFGGALFGIDGFVDEDGGVGQRGAIAPEAVNDVIFQPQGDVFGGEGSLKLLQAGSREHIGRDAGGGVCRQHFGQPVDMGAAETEFFQTDAAAGKLFFSLLPITAVRPQGGFVFGYRQRADRAGKAGNPAAGLPVLGQVFGKVRVGRRNNPSVELVLFHRCAQGSETLGGSGHWVWSFRLIELVHHSVQEGRAQQHHGAGGQPDGAEHHIEALLSQRFVISVEQLAAEREAQRKR